MGVLAPPTLIASIYGMNIPLPGGVNAGDLLTFGILLAVMAACGAGILFYMRHHKYL
jgi:Mg2+ and Co2+ transporter CorA